MQGKRKGDHGSLVHVFGQFSSKGMRHVQKKN